ncbi:hypothetical protein PR048_011948 [Dryococelus australis]|uniref:Uncharacterized protein n=1 Tax=Dryococelus australis TaxID=614101 RepID=A0ABQ9HN22_9NEOP|nr:hypothetical protein PR048_011948 [Dryococelus australis]
MKGMGSSHAAHMIWIRVAELCNQQLATAKMVASHDATRRNHWAEQSLPSVYMTWRPLQQSCQFICEKKTILGIPWLIEQNTNVETAVSHFHFGDQFMT